MQAKLDNALEEFIFAVTMKTDSFRRLCPSRILQGFVAVILVTFLLLMFLPEVVSALWHYRHGSFTSFQDWEVFVPKGWWAFTHDGQLVIQKMNRFYVTKAPSGIVVDTLNIPETLDSEKLKKSRIESISRDGYTFQFQSSEVIHSHTGYCLNFASIREPARVWVACDFPTAHITASLLGEKAYSEDFYSVIRQLRSDNLHSDH